MDGMNRTVAKTARWAGAGIVIAATAYSIYTVASLDGRQEDARETAYQESHAASHPEGYDVGYDERYPAAYDSGRDDGLAAGDERGHEEAYPLGLEEGRIEGYNSGHSVGLDEGQTQGYESGYTDGNIAGLASGYEDAFPDGFADGREVGLSTRVGLHDPTYLEMRSFLLTDRTSTTVYDLDDNNCMDYSTIVGNNAEAAGIRAAIVLLTYEPLLGVETSDHSIIAFDTTDRGLVFVEPQSDETAYPTIGERWQDAIPLPPGYYWLPSPEDDVIEEIQVVW